MIDNRPDFTSPDLVGYCDRLHYRPGETVEVFVHGEGTVNVDLVRLHGADPRVQANLPLETVVESVPRVRAEAQRQRTRAGSFGVVEDFLLPRDIVELQLTFWFYPTLARNGKRQGLLALHGDGEVFVLAIDGHGRLELATQGEILCRTDRSVPNLHWIRVSATQPLGAGRATLSFHTALALPGDIGSGRAERQSQSDLVPGTTRLLLTIGASDAPEDDAGVRYGKDCFNGKIEGIEIAGRAADGVISAIGAWDFSKHCDSDRFMETTGRNSDGLLINLPTRAVTGRHWNGDEVDFRRAPEHYAAVHFHEDDFEDAQWKRTCRVALPDVLESGVYAVRVTQEGRADQIPLFVLPSLGATKAEIAFLAPTFSYQAYANASLSDRIDYFASGISGRVPQPVARDAQMQFFPEVRGSLYDVHTDGSGRCYSSYKRPIFNMRADFISGIQGVPRHIGGDLYLTGWLESLSLRHDVLTDHALDTEPDLLDDYRVVITGSHPEYCSARMLSALEAFVARGGKLMYLGGNGFYWVTSQDLIRPHIVECRRGHAGIRTWESAPGEVHLSSTGEQGGLWRYRGRAPNRLVGVGMASQGWDSKAPGYRRNECSYRPEYSWVFDGVASDTFGENGFAMDGASGDELDRYDPALGSPAHAVVLATSLPHSRFYKLAVEDVSMLTEGLCGGEDERVRSDMVLVEWANEGAVFSVGSIGWAAALAWNNFDNDVERVTRNVLYRFLESGAERSSCRSSEGSTCAESVNESSTLR